MLNEEERIDPKFLELLKKKLGQNSAYYNLPRNEFKLQLAGKWYQQAAGKMTVFIDLNHWIGFRMALSDKENQTTPEKNQVYLQIYNQLRKLVKAQKIICLLSSSIIEEMEKILPLEKRVAMAIIMDGLKCKLVLNHLTIGIMEIYNASRAIRNTFLISNYQYSSIFDSNSILSKKLLDRHHDVPEVVFNLFYEEATEKSLQDYLTETNSVHEDSSTW